MRRSPALFVAKEASIRLKALRDLSQLLYFSCGSLVGLKEFVLAVSVQQDTLWIWMVFGHLSDEMRETLNTEATRYDVVFVDLSLVEEEEAERFRERYVKGTESYRIIWNSDIDGLFDQFERMFLERVP